jgi:hypothetical protein
MGEGLLAFGGAFSRQGAWSCQQPLPTLDEFSGTECIFGNKETHCPDTGGWSPPCSRRDRSWTEGTWAARVMRLEWGIGSPMCLCRMREEAAG